MVLGVLAGPGSPADPAAGACPAAGAAGDHAGAPGIEDAPNAEIHSGTVALTNPVAAAGRPQEWLYYVRAFLETSGAEDGEPDDAVWSSPVWVTWSR